MLRLAVDAGLNGSARRAVARARHRPRVAARSHGRVHDVSRAAGRWRRPRGIISVFDARRRQVLDRPVERDAILSPAGRVSDDDACCGTSIERGTGAPARALGVRGPVGGKTGTTDEYRDAWFVGFSTSVVVGVWVGFDQPAPIGREAYGARVALPIWADFMKRTARSLPAREFAVPDGVADRGAVPRLVPAAGRGVPDLHRILQGGRHRAVAAVPDPSRHAEAARLARDRPDSFAASAARSSASSGDEASSLSTTRWSTRAWSWSSCARATRGRTPRSASPRPTKRRSPRCSESAYDVVVLDYWLGSRDGLSLLREVSSEASTRPVIVLTGRGDEDVAVEAMKSRRRRLSQQDDADDREPRARGAPRGGAARRRAAAAAGGSGAARERRAVPRAGREQLGRACC